MVARPSKSANTIVGKHGKDKLESRKKGEDRLKGKNIKLKPPNRLNSEQKKIFKFIVDMLEDSNILGSPDTYILERASCCIDIIQQCEKILNEQGLFDLDGKPHQAHKIKKDEMTIFFRIINELSLSPQARAKFVNLTLEKERSENDSLIRLLNDDDE